MRTVKTLFLFILPAFFMAAFSLPHPYTAGQPLKTPVPRGLDANGPWIIMHNPTALLVANADGTGLEQLFAGKGIRGIALSPDSRSFAVILDDTPMEESNGLSLAIYHLPDGRNTVNLPLQNPAHPPNESFADEPHRAIIQGDPAWSHDGQSIAFTAQVDGPSADLYRYDLETGTVTRLSQEDDQAYEPSWSPDDRFIFYSAATAFGTGAGFGNAGSWFVSRDGSKTIATTTKDQSNQVMVWVSPNMAVLSEFGVACGPKNIRLFNVDTGKSYSVWPYEVKDVAYSEATGQLALLIPSDFSICTIDTQPTGLYLLEIKSGHMREISSTAYQGLKLDASNGRGFILRSEYAVFRMDASGKIQFLNNSRTSEAEYSAAANLWLWYKRPDLDNGVWVGSLTDTPRQVYDHPIGETTMSPGGKSIYFMERGIGHLYRADAPDFDPVLIVTSDKLGDWSHVIYADPSSPSQAQN